MGSGENARHFSIAGGSALECAAVCDATFILSLIDKSEYNGCKNLIVDIVSMLSKFAWKGSGQVSRL